MKILSIIVPTYNMEVLLHQCLDSLIIDDSELFKTLEVLIVNDGSKDKSLVIAQDYERRYPEIFHVINKPNGNYGSCINAALPLALGKYIKVLDADDSFNTENLAEMLSVLKEIDVDIFISDYEIVNEKGTVQAIRKSRFPKNVEFNILDYLQDQNVFQMHSVAYKTQNLRDIKYCQTERASYTDVEWVFSPIAMVKEAYYFPKVIYRYLIGRIGQTVAGNTVHKKTNERFRILQHCVDLYSQISKWSIHPNALLYIEKHLAFQVHGLYFSLIFINQDLDSVSLLDSYLKENALAFYNLSDSYVVNRYFPYKFISYCRKTGKLPPTIYYKLYTVLKNIATLIR